MAVTSAYAAAASTFEKMLADDHHRLYIVLCEDVPIGYVEIYEAARDRLSHYYKAEESDMGWHLLLGDTAVVGKGYLKPIVMMLSKFIFEHTDAKKIVGEPDSKVEAYKWVADGFAYQLQRLIDMPEKKASLYFVIVMNFLNRVAISNFMARLLYDSIFCDCWSKCVVLVMSSQVNDINGGIS